MKKLLNLRPILYMAISLCCGIATAYCFLSGAIVWGVFFTLVFALCLCLFLFVFTDGEHKKQNAVFAFIFLVFYIIGAFNVSAHLIAFDNANLNYHQYSVTGKVVQKTERDGYIKLVLDDVDVVGKNTGKLAYKVGLYVYGKTDLDIGDYVNFTQKLQDNSYVFEGKFNMYVVESGIKYQASVNADQIKIVGNSLTLFERIKLFMRDTLKVGLGEKEFGVGYALLTGESDLMDNDLTSAYRTAGIAHIFAVSGLHIGFLASALTFVFNKLRLRGLKKPIIITCVLILYSGICAFSASSIRATVMTAVMLFATEKGHRYDGLSALALSAILVLLIQPVQLFCVGFQLSFAVVIGINLLSSPIARLLKFVPEKVAHVIGVVLSAQIFSIPISLNAFGSFSTIAVMANLIFIPIVSVIFTVTLLATVIGGLFAIANITLFLPNIAFYAINVAISVLDYPLFMVGGLVFGGGIIAYYLSTIIASGFFNFKIKMRAVISIMLSCICLITATASTIAPNVSNQVNMCVSGSENFSATTIFDNDNHILIVSDAHGVFYTVSQLKRIYEQNRLNDIDAVIVMGASGVDLQVLASKICHYANVKRLIYYGQKQEMMETVIHKTFGKISITNALDGKLDGLGFDFEFALNGNAIIGRIKGKSIAILSSFRKGAPDLKILPREFDYMVAHTDVSVTFATFDIGSAISYMPCDNYPNGQSNGNLYVKIT